MIVNPLLALLFVFAFLVGLYTKPPAHTNASGGGSPYSVDVVGVEYDTVEGAFAPEGWKGAFEENMHGIRPKVIFTVTNTSRESYLLPVPKNFYLTGDYYDEEQPRGVSYYEPCACYVSSDAGQATLVDEDNQYTSAIDKVVINGDETSYKMKPGEQLRFKIFFFAPPFHIDGETFKFCGFTYIDALTHKYTEVTFEIDITTRKVKKVYSGDTTRI